MRSATLLTFSFLALCATTEIHAQTLTFTSGTHVIPVGTYSEISVDGTANAILGPGVDASSLNIYGANSSMDISGGVFSNVVQLYGSLLITGGTFNSGIVTQVGFTANLDIQGGTVGGNLTARGNTTVNLSGGTVGSTGSDTVVGPGGVFNWSGGNIGGHVDLIGTGVWNIYGTTFFFNGTQFNAGDSITLAGNPGLFIPGGSYDSSSLQVILGDGFSRTVPLLVSNGGNPAVAAWTGSINLVAIPEPAHYTTLAGIVGVGVVLILRRGRRTSAQR